MVGVRLGIVALLCLFVLVQGGPAGQATSELPLKHTYPAHEKELVSNRGLVAGRLREGGLAGEKHPPQKKNDMAWIALKDQKNKTDQGTWFLVGGAPSPHA